MQQTSETWKALWASGNAKLETKAVIAGVEYTAISTPVITRASLQNGAYVGNAISAMCLFSLRPTGTIPKSAKVQIFMRLSEGTTSGENSSGSTVTKSEWRPAGTFFLAKRSYDQVAGVLSIECYDSLMKGNAGIQDAIDWITERKPWTTDEDDVITTDTGEWIYFPPSFPRSMSGIARDLAMTLDVELDDRTQIREGAEYVIDGVKGGSTINDVLSMIAAANGGNWVITPENKLRLVPFISCDGADSATEDVVDVLHVIGGMYVGNTSAVTGVRNDDGGDEPVIIGDDTGFMIDTALSDALALNLSEEIIGVEYQPYDMKNAIYDPAAEIGDYLRGGTTGTIRSVLYNESVRLSSGVIGDLTAPDPTELTDEFPYVAKSKKTLTLAKAYAKEVAEDAMNNLDQALDQDEVFNRLTNNGQAQGMFLLNGQLYVNASYINTGKLVADLIEGGTLTLGGLNNGNGILEIKDADDNTIGTWDNQGLSLNKGSIYITRNENMAGFNAPVAYGAYTGYYPLFVQYKQSGINYATTLLVKDGVFSLEYGVIGSGAHNVQKQVTIEPDKIKIGIAAGEVTITHEGITITDYQGNEWFIADPGLTGDGRLWVKTLIRANELNLDTPLDISGGGTGANTAAGARAALGLGDTSYDFGGQGPNVRVMRSGNVCSLIVAVGNYSNSGTHTAIKLDNVTMNIPTGYRPTGVINTVDTVTGERIYIAATGSIISAAAVTNATLRFSATWITTDAWPT